MDSFTWMVLALLGWFSAELIAFAIWGDPIDVDELRTVVATCIIAVLTFPRRKSP